MEKLFIDGRDMPGVQRVSVGKTEDGRILLFAELKADNISLDVEGDEVMLWFPRYSEEVLANV